MGDSLLEHAESARILGIPAIRIKTRAT